MLALYVALPVALAIILCLLGLVWRWQVKKAAGAQQKLPKVDARTSSKVREAAARDDKRNVVAPQALPMPHQVEQVPATEEVVEIV